MARKKKLPLIEDFDNIPEEALVPEDEQPYEIPDHWKWVRLGSVLHPMVSRKPDVGTFTYLDIASIDNETQSISQPTTRSSSNAPSRANRAVHEGDVLFSLVRPYLRNIALVPKHFSESIASTGFYVCSPSEPVNSVFMFNWLRSGVFIGLITNKMRGDNSPSVKARDFEKAPFPLPPTEEQELIVEKLEARLTQIDQAIERTEAVLVDVDRQMANLVRAAVSGHLTKAWREANIRSGSYVKRQNTDEFVNLSAEKCEARKKGFPLIEDFNRIPEDSQVPENEQPHDIPTDWRWVRLGSVCEVNPSKPNLKGLDEDRSTAFIPMAAVSDDSGTVMEVQERPLRKVFRGYTYFGSGDVLFAKITPCMENGKSAIVPNLSGGLGFGSTEFFVLRPIRNIIETELLHAFLRSPWFRAIAKGAMTGAVGQQRVPKAFLESYPYPLAPLGEQKEIVSVLGRHLESYRSAQSLLNESLKILRELRSSTVSASLAGRI